MRTAAVLLSLAVAVPAVAAEDISGIWLGPKAGLVIHREAEASWVGHPTDLKGTASITWHFYRLGEGSYRFWVIIHGKGSEHKFAEQEFAIVGDEMTVPVSTARGEPGELKFTRYFRRIPAEIAGVKITFRAPRKDDPGPDQYVDRRLTAAFEAAVTGAKKACPDLRRVLISATVGTRSYGGSHHRRERRSGLAIGAINGVAIPACGDAFAEASRRLKAGEPAFGSREAFGPAALTLLASFAAQKDLVEIGAPDLLGAGAAGYQEWFLENRRAGLPGKLTRAAWLERWKALAKKGSNGKYAGRIHLAVKPAKLKFRLKDVWKEKYDRK